MKSTVRLLVTLFVTTLTAMAGQTLTVSAMDTEHGMQLDGDSKFVPQGPNGETVLRTDGKLEGVIDLGSLGIEPAAYDLLKIDVKADSRAWLIISLANYPRPGWTSRWYPLDAVRAGFDWRTIWLDLKRPEEMFKAGGYGGTRKDDTASRRLNFSARVQPAKRLIQDPGRAVLLRNLRFARQAVRIDWDQTSFHLTAKKGQDLVYTYPLTVANPTDKPIAAKVELLPFKVKDAQATVSPASVEIAPQQTAIVQAMAILPAGVAATKPPLYSEFFEARASVVGMPDSEVTILRSADPIHLSVTVPVPEKNLKPPMLPRRKDLPPSVLAFPAAMRARAEALAAAANPDDLDAWLGKPAPDRFQSPWRPGKNDAEDEVYKRYLHSVSACAWLYDLTGEKKYLEKGTALLLRFAERFSALRKRWAAEEMAIISDGIVDTYTLALGWNVGGHWAPYQFPPARYTHGDGLINNFDLLAADMDPAARETIINDFIVPAALQMRNHYIGLNNQQDVVNYPVLYAGLLTRNWPLVAHAYASEHGVLGMLQWQFDEDGLCNEGHYQTASIRPLLWSTELLYHAAGIDLYNERLYTILHSKSASAIGQGFKDAVLSYLDENRFAGKPFLKELQAQPETDGYHLAGGVTQLKWQGLTLSMNWGTHIFRNAHDRCTPRFEVAPKHPLAALNGAGGGTYSHNSFDQSILVVDENIQNSEPAEITGFDVTGPVQFVQASSDKHFPGTTITRTFAIIGPHALVVDRVRSTDGKPHTIDWIFKNQAVELSIPLEDRQGSWTTKPDIPTKAQAFGAGIPAHQYAGTATTFANRASLMTMLGEPATEVYTYPVHYRMKALMVRRRDVLATDYVALFSADVQSVERLPVTTGDRHPADAVGLGITLKDGRIFHVIVNNESAKSEARLDGLVATEPFATDYTDWEK